jgi:hypothetical protein
MALVGPRPKTLMRRVRTIIRMAFSNRSEVIARRKVSIDGTWIRRGISRAAEDDCLLLERTCHAFAKGKRTAQFIRKRPPQIIES